MTLDPGTIITSVHNPGIRRARSLLRRKGRYEERAFLVEGIRAVTDTMAAGAMPEIVYVRDGMDERTWASRLPDTAPVRLVSTDVLASLSDVPHPQGVVAVVPMAAVQSVPRHDVWRHDLVLVADGVADPGNLGTLLRSAAGTGTTEVLITPRSVDPFHPRCVRGAMAAHFLVSLRQPSLDEIAERLGSLPLVAVADADGDVDYDSVDWSQPCAVIVGSEAFGPKVAIRELANAHVRIPLARKLESLNAGVAGSHLLLEAARQRRHVSGAQRPVRES